MNKKLILISVATLSVIILAAVFMVTHTHSNVDKLLMKNVEALAQDPDRPPFNCPDTGDVPCWTDDGISIKDDEEIIDDDPLVIWKPN